MCIKNNQVILFVLLLVISAPQLLLADKAKHTQKLGLEKIVSDVLLNNPELRLYLAEIEIAKGEQISAGTFSNPEISSNFGQKKVTSSPGSDEGVAWSVSLQQTFEWPGRIGLRKAIAEKQVKRAEIGVARFKTALTASASSLAYRLFVEEEKYRIAAEVSQRLEDLRKVLSQRNIAGVTPMLELRIIEASALALQREKTTAEVEVQFLQLELNRLRGEPWQEVLHVKEPELEFLSLPDSETLLAAAVSNSLEIKEYEAELESSDFKLKLAENERYPEIKAGPYFTRESADNTEKQLGIGISVPLPFWNRNSGKIQSAKAQREKAESALAVGLRKIEQDLIANVRRYNAKVADLQNWKPESLIEFRKAAEVADQHFRQGAVPISTYVELQKQYLETAEMLLDTKAEAFTAEREIKKLSGLEFAAVKIKD